MLRFMFKTYNTLWWSFLAAARGARIYETRLLYEIRAMGLR